ncbi:hypothetical protein [Cellvibrio fontiphilus]|uniref:Uncharacterized protein n=1 Tax=Cellvibrio fontiphilus TaxID=1815559 RepID=A0ABV7FGN9_9GAMM
MTEKYQCAVCNNKFKTTDAVDGFKKGYKVGFLCPFCKSNIMETGNFSNSLSNLRFGLSYASAIILAFFAIRTDLNVFISSGETSTRLIALTGLMILATSLLCYINRSVLFKETILYTRKVTE